MTNLQRYRERSGWSRYRLAKNSGVTLPTIANLEKGITTRAHYTTLLALSIALGVPVDALRF